MITGTSIAWPSSETSVGSFGLVVGRHALDDAVAETADLARQLGHVGLEGGVLAV